LNSTTPLRLAYLVSQYPTISHTFILREIRKLRALGCDIQVVSVRAPDRDVTQLTPDEREEYQRTLVIFAAGMTAIVGAHLKTILRRPVAYFAGLLYAIRLAKWDLREMFLNVMYFGEAVVAGSWIWARGLTHVHSHFSSTLELFVARVFPITYSATIHGSGEFDDVVGFYMAEKVARAAFLIGISQYGRSQMMRASDPQHWHKLEVVPLGVEPSVFLPRAQRENSERFEIVCVGSLVPAKGYHILLAAAARLLQQGRTAWRLRLVGEGRARASLENTIRELGLEDYVRLEGACNQERVREIYRESDLFVLTSFAEGVPVVLMEAMAMEIPCLATWITGVPELIRHGVDGWLVPPGDAEPVAEALSYLMDQPALRESMGKSGRARVIEKYNLEQNVARLAGIFRQRLA